MQLLMARTFIISGGGTGGHIFPAVSIANALKKRHPNATIHFVGALGKMEMTKVPASGYPITGVPIAGINRKKPWKSWNVPFKLLIALSRCRKLLKSMSPDVVIGTGGYASGPVLLMAQRMGIPTIVQEQNSYAGITNIRLGKKAQYICTAYENAARFFPKARVRLTGNPIREVFTRALPNQNTCKKQLGFNPSKKLLLVLGGSLGAKAINKQIAKNLVHIMNQGWQVMWQCGKLYEKEYQGMTRDGAQVQAFIENMSVAYAAADGIVSRAGAGTLSELCVIGKPALIIPSPNVAEDHQTHNAMALSEKHAAILVKENEMNDLLLDKLAALKDPDTAKNMGIAIKSLALPKATEDIVNLIDALSE